MISLVMIAVDLLEEGLGVEGAGGSGGAGDDQLHGDLAFTAELCQSLLELRGCQRVSLELMPGSKSNTER